MATIIVNTAKRLFVKFDEKELRPYMGLQAFVETWLKKKYVNLSLPFITWQGHDLRVATELIKALKLVGNYGSKATGRRVAWNAHAPKPTINRADKIRVPVNPKHSEPYVQVERGADGFVKWTVQGHYFNDDLPTVAAYVAALTKLVERVKTNGL